MLTKLLDDAKASARAGVVKPSIRSQVLSKLKGVEDLLNNPFVQKGSLKVGKKKDKSNVTTGNVVDGKRKLSSAEDTTSDKFTSSSVSVSDSVPPIKKAKNKGQGRPPMIGKGDVVSLPSQAFDGEEPGSFSDDHPDPCFGQVLKVSKQGLAQVK